MPHWVFQPPSYFSALLLLSPFFLHGFLASPFALPLFLASWHPLCFFPLLYLLLNLQSQMWSRYHLYGNRTFQHTAFAPKNICPFLAAPGGSNLHVPCQEQPGERLQSRAAFLPEVYSAKLLMESNIFRSVVSSQLLISCTSDSSKT